MGVFTFVCRNSGGEWSAKQIGESGDLQASDADLHKLQRSLVSAASAKDSSGGVQSSFAMVTPSSAVFQVTIGGGIGGGFVGASAGGAAAAPTAEKEEEKKEEKEESDDEMSICLFN